MQVSSQIKSGCILLSLSYYYLVENLENCGIEGLYNCHLSTDKSDYLDKKSFREHWLPGASAIYRPCRIAGTLCGSGFFSKSFILHLYIVLLLLPAGLCEDT